MQIELSKERAEEQIIVRVTIINPSPIAVPISSRFACMFGGKTSVAYGRHTYRYPVSNVPKQRLVGALRRFHPGLYVETHADGTEVV